MNVVSDVDVFISYEHESSAIVSKIVTALEENGIRCWYAPRNIIAGSYAKSIVEGIGKCQVFLLVLTEQASNSNHVLNEVEIAYKRLINDGITLMPFKVTQDITNEEMQYYINRLQWVDAVNLPLEKAIHELLAKLKPMFGLTDSDNNELVMGHLKATQRATNQYFSHEDKFEVDRLEDEGTLLLPYETNFYDEIFFNKDNINVLDVNVLHAGNSIKRLFRKEVNQYVGLTYSKDAVEAYKQLYPNENISFKYINYDDPNFDRTIKDYMKELNIKSFDIINFSMAILDMKNPESVILKLRRLLSQTGIMYFRDIDDGVNLYYPDENNLMKKYFELADADKLAGFRRSGRQIYSYLKHAGCKDIELKMTGLNTSNMDIEQKQLFFSSYFSFLNHEYEKLLEEDPENEGYIKAKKWLDENMADIEDNFFKDDFMFNGGFIVYIGKF